MNWIIWILVAFAAGVILNKSLGRKRTGLASGSGLKLPKLPSLSKGVWYGVGGLVGIIVVVVILNYANADGNLNLGVWVPGGILVALMVLAIMGRGGKPTRWVLAFGVLFVAIIFVFNYGFGDKADEVANKLREKAATVATEESRPVSTTSSAPVLAVVREDKMRWKETTEDGSLPVGVWSETFKVPLATSAFLTNGEGELYIMRFKFKHQEEWTTHIPGTHVAGDEFQVKILELGRGMKEAPITIVRR